MRNRTSWKLLLVLLGLLGGGYTLPTQAAGVVTDCSTFGATTVDIFRQGNPNLYIPYTPETLGAALVGGGDVTFACSGTIIVPEIVLELDTTIDATGQTVTLSGNQINPVLRIREVQVELTNLTITQGTHDSFGGGIRNDGGTVTVTGCTVSGNKSQSSGGGIYNSSWNSSPVGTIALIDTVVSDNSANTAGGGIHNGVGGMMTLTRSRVSGNSSGGAGGGGIYSSTGTIVLTDSVVSDNTSGIGGGIGNAGQLTLINSTVLRNSATGTAYGGGGIANYLDATITLSNSTVQSNYANRAGGGIYTDNRATMTIADSTISDNRTAGFAGGIANLGTQTTITNSTISGNRAGERGGGINNFIGLGEGRLSITNSTISGNTSVTTGGGIENYAPLTLTHVTFADNSAAEGGSLYVANSSSAAISLNNTLITTSSAIGNCVDQLNLITDGGYNLSSDNTCNLTPGISLPNTNPNLGPLADNGGPTQTHALLAGSPAIDRIPGGANGCGTDITTDQRGVTRPQGANCDIGAYEVAMVLDTQPPTVSDLSATPNPTPPNAPVTLTATLDDRTTGNSNIASAEYNVDGGTWTPMNPADGAFDSPFKAVTATLTFPATQAGTRTLCVRGTDAAANVSDGTACTTVTVTPVDTTPPDITPTVSGTLGNNGWYKSDVTVSWSVVDNESTITSQVGCDPTTVTADTAGVTFTCEAASDGGAASQSVTVQRDVTLPTITGSASPAANANGWNNSPVMINFTCTDETSGIADCAPPQTLGEGSNQTANGAATDNAGHSASASVTGINVDLTAPDVMVTGVTDGATYTLGAVPTAGCDTTDALSGVQTQATLSVTGGDANGLGVFTAQCTGAMDNAGNTDAASVTYQVTAPLPTNQPPVAHAGSNQTVRLGSLVMLDGRASSDPDQGPSPLSFVWTQTTGPNVALTGANTPQPTFIPTVAGAYTFSLTVNDGQDDSVPAAVTITVPALGDLNNDGVIDQNDLNQILAARNTPANGPNDLRDLDGDGTITVLDARKLTLLCTRPRCATP